MAHVVVRGAQHRRARAPREDAGRGSRRADRSSRRTRAKRLWIPGGETAAVPSRAARDDPESIAFLARAGADLDARDDNGAVAMHHAAFAGAPRAARSALIAAGADPDAQDRRDGSTPAILAAYGSRREVLNRLIDAHPAVDLTLRDVGGATVAGHYSSSACETSCFGFCSSADRAGAGVYGAAGKIFSRGNGS